LDFSRGGLACQHVKDAEPERMMRMSLVARKGSRLLHALNLGEFAFCCWTAHRHRDRKITSIAPQKIARIERSGLGVTSMN
jgi:hypothetical protein